MDIKFLFYLLCCVGVSVATSSNSSSSGDETTAAEPATTTATSTEPPAATTGPCTLNEECSQDLVSILTARAKGFLDFVDNGNETGQGELFADDFRRHQCGSPVVDCIEDLIEQFAVRERAKLIKYTFCLSITTEKVFTEMLVFVGGTGVLWRISLFWQLEEDGEYRIFHNIAMPFI